MLPLNVLPAAKPIEELSAARCAVVKVVPPSIRVRAEATLKNRSPLIVAPVMALLALPSENPVPPLNVHVPPEIVPLFTVIFWLLDAVADTASVALPVSVSDSALARLWTERLPVTWMLGLPATLMVTSSLDAGIELLDQLAGSLQFTPSPAPVHATALKSWRLSSDS